MNKTIKRCKAIKLEFLKLKEKLGLCLYEDICDEQELISMSEEILRKKIIAEHDVENKQLKEEIEKVESRKVESRKVENEKEEGTKVESRKEENEKVRKENGQLRKKKT